MADEKKKHWTTSLKEKVDGLEQRVNELSDQVGGVVPPPVTPDVVNDGLALDIELLQRAVGSIVSQLEQARAAVNTLNEKIETHRRTVLAHDPSYMHHNGLR